VSAADTWAKKARQIDCETPRGKPYAARDGEEMCPTGTGLRLYGRDQGGGQGLTRRALSEMSYRLTLTQYYEELYEEGLRYIAVEEYAGEWESLDPQVTGIEGYLRAGVNGPVWGGGFLYQRQDSPHFTPGDWAVRTLVPSWAGIYVHVSDDFGFYQCGQIYVKLLRQPTGYTWEFWFNICKGETWPGGW